MRKSWGPAGKQQCSLSPGAAEGGAWEMGGGTMPKRTEAGPSKQRRAENDHRYISRNGRRGLEY